MRTLSRSTSRSRLRTGFGIVAAAALAVVLAACSSSSGGSAPPSGSGADTGSAGGSSAPSLAGQTITLGDQANGLQTLANAAGVFKDAPYNVKWAEFQGAAPLFQAMTSGDVDTGTAADLPTLTALGGGLDIKNVAATKNSGAGTVIIVPKGSDIKTVQDLKGKKVVVSSARGSIAEYLLAKALQNVGLSYSDVTVQYLLPTDAQAAFNAGQVDIWATFGIYGQTAIAQGAKVIVDGTDGRTSGVGIITATDKVLSDPTKKAVLADALNRIAKAYQWSVQNTAAYAQAYSTANNVPLATATLLVNLSLGYLVPVSPDIITSVQAVNDLMVKTGILPTSVDVKANTDSSAFPKALPGTPEDGLPPQASSSAPASSSSSK
jgi:sulfonate transport system substrate-binding protein